MMYENPIEMIIADTQYKIQEQVDKAVFSAVTSCGIDVKKEELIKALNYDRQQYEKGYADAKTERRWVPVNERLPDMDGLYLVTVHIWENARKIIGVATSATHWSDGDWRMFDADDVVAWMPLPEPYREGETK